MRSRYILPLIPGILFSGAGAAEAAKVKAPAAPTNLTVKAVGVNSFKLDWKDNSTDETGWEVLVAMKGGKPSRYVLVPSPNITTYTLSTVNNELPGKELVFQLRAYKVVDGKEKFSKKSTIVSAKALPKSTFGAPTNLKAKTVNDGQILLTWKDNSSSENGYQIEYRPTKSKKWEALGVIPANTKFRIPSYDYDPNTSYSFRVRAYKGNPVSVTAYSKVAKAKTKKFQAPTKFAVTSEGDGQFAFKWKDNSSIEAGYELERKVGTGAFTVQGSVGPNVSSTTPVAFNPNTAYQFRLRGFRYVETKKVYTSYSNTVSIKSTYLKTPTSVAAKAVSDTSATVTWKDQSKRETGYEIRYRQVGSGAYSSGSAAANAGTFTATGLIPGKNYEFQVRAVMSGFLSPTYYSTYSSTATTLTKDGIAGNLNPPIFRGTSFSYLVDASRASQLNSLTVTGLPAGLSYNPANRMITGTTTEEGVKTVALKATFKDGSVISRDLKLRIIRPEEAPVVVASIPSVSVGVGSTSNVDLAGKFSDPDTASAARFTTSKGVFDIILYSLATPGTVDNFLDYVDAGRYNDTFFHRSVVDTTNKLHILQGGGFKYTSTDGFKSVTKYTTTVTNEPGISNRRGTVAMAKTPNNPNSASSEFFVNADDVNASNLDEQNGGFTVFGRVPESGLDVIDAIQDLPTRSYSISGLAGDFSKMPMNAATAPAVMEPDKLVKVTSVAAAPILTYSVTSANEAVATATVSANKIVVTGVAAGSTTLTVTATDLDGETVSQTVTVTVP